jgi:hypothetical protein
MDRWPDNPRGAVAWHVRLDEERSERADHRRNRLAWLVVAGLGMLVFEWTANPSLTVLLGCVKFGWDELRRARLVRKFDPDPARRRVMVPALAAYALWRTSVVAAVVMFAVPIASAFLYEFQNRPARLSDWTMNVVLTALLTVLGGFAIAWLIAFWAVVAALRNRVKIWLGRRANRAKLMMLTTSLVVGLPFTALATALVSLWLTIPVVLVGFPTTVLLLADFLDARVLARWPGECWGGPKPFDPDAPIRPDERD